MLSTIINKDTRNTTLWWLGPEAHRVWLLMLTLTDETGYARVHPGVVPRLAGLEPESAQKALKVLSEPVEHSDNPQDEGRYLRMHEGCNWEVLGDWWKPSEVKRREYQRAYQRKRRAASRQEGGQDVR